MPFGVGEEITGLDVVGLGFRGAKEVHQVPHVDRPRLDQRVVGPERRVRPAVTSAVKRLKVVERPEEPLDLIGDVIGRLAQLSGGPDWSWHRAIVRTTYDAKSLGS